MKSTRSKLIWMISVLSLAVLLSLLDGVGLTLTSFLAYGSLLLILLLVGVVLWEKVVLDEKPKWLLAAVLSAFVIRVFLGLGFLHGLPNFGYQDSQTQRAGYAFFDAYKRDRDSLSRARSEYPLSSAFTDREDSDQYGGLLYVSAAIYRYMSPDVHRPILIVTLVAAVSSYAVLFMWAFYKRTWSQQGSKIASWILVLYPEAVMLGASQMREPFLIASFAASLYGYKLVQTQQTRAGFLTISLAIGLLALPFSPPFAIAILSFLGMVWVIERRRIKASRLLTISLVMIIALIALTLTVRSWQGPEYAESTAWRIFIDWWEDVGGDWRITFIGEQSLWLDIVLDWLPAWADIPFLVAYGLLQPFLPASIAATGAPIWRVIAIWRSLGWYLLLPFLIYAPSLAIREKGWRSFEAILSIAIWITALVASYRALGFQWDNPRYRAVFLAAQAAIAAWVWITSRRQNSAWIKRIYLLIVGATILVLQWYLGRYYGTPRLGLGMTLVAVIGFFGISFSTFLFFDLRRRKMAGQEIDQP